MNKTKGYSSLLSLAQSTIAFLRYNASCTFAGRFVYFLLLAVAIFLAVVVIYVLDEEAPPTAEAVYYFLAVPGVLLVFYPSAWSIQNDADSRMLETLFGIPDHRYKVWLARLVTMYLAIGILMGGLAFFSRMMLADFSVGWMLYHSMFPVIFIGGVGFLSAAMTRSGTGTAVVLVIVIMGFWIAAEPLEASRWNLFFNPFVRADAFEEVLRREAMVYNRIYILVASALTIMMGLLLLQRREKYI